MRQLGRAAKILCVGIISVLPCSSACVGQEVKTLPRFVPAAVEGGVIRSWGDEAMGGVMKAWEDAFCKYHPDISFQSKLYGSGTGMAGIITGVSDLSLMGRPATSNEIMGFEWVFRYKPLGVQVMTGNLKEDGKTPALVVFVHKSNPLTQISMSQLAAMFGCPGGAGNLHSPTWELAGLRGAWRGREIHAYLYDSETGTGSFLQKILLGKGDRWNWSVVKEFKDQVREDGTVYPAGQQIVDALRKDPNGIAVSTLGHAGADVKALALSSEGEAVGANRASLMRGSYPLTRTIYIYVNRKPDKPVDARVKEFLQFIMSQEGQDAVRRKGDFLPLPVKADLEQVKKLE